MPRIKEYRKEYARRDMQAWIRNEMKRQKITQADIGKKLGVSGQGFSQKLRNMSFKYDELYLIFNTLNAEPKEIIYFMKGGE